MPYAALEDVQAEFLNLTFTNATPVTDTEVEDFIDTYSMVIDGWVSNRYAVPVTGAASLAMLKEVCVALVKSKIKRILARGAGAKQESQEKVALEIRKEAMDILRSIKKGEQDLHDATRKAPVTTSYGYINEQQAVFKKDEDQW